MKKRAAGKKAKRAGRSKAVRDLAASKKGGAARGGLTLGTSSLRATGIGGTATGLGEIRAIDPYQGISLEF